MEVPERLALIGGSILLSSTLVFTLKSQASSIIPSVGHSISNVFDHIGDAKRSSDFNNNFKQAQQNGWKTGTWGTAKYYIDNDHNMYVGSGELQGNAIRNMLGNNGTDLLKSINIEQPVKAPQDSSNLFSTSNGDTIYNSSLQAINGLGNVDTSQVTNMHNLFTNDSALKRINGISDWDTSQVTNMAFMFNNIPQLTNINLSHWNTAKTTDMSWMFDGDDILQKLNISSFDTTHANTNGFIGGPSWQTNNMLNEVDLGSNTRLNSSSGISTGDWQSNGQSINTDTINDGNSHPGDWTKQYGHATNLSPVHETNNWNGEGWEYPWSFHAEKGKTYYLSADFHHVTANNGEFNSVQAVGGWGNAALWQHNIIPNGQSGRTITKWVANQTGNINFAFGDDSTDKINNIAITQSDSYVPYENTVQSNDK